MPIHNILYYYFLPEIKMDDIKRLCRTQLNIIIIIIERASFINLKTKQTRKQTDILTYKCGIITFNLFNK